MSMDEWKTLLRRSNDMGIEIQLGCKTLSSYELKENIDRASLTESKMLRLVLENEDHQIPTFQDLYHLLETAIPHLETYGIRLAIENHFDISSKMLAKLLRELSSPTLGFCVDSANSLRCFEPPSYVLETLGPKAFCYHIKDYKVIGNQLGFTVKGAPLGEGNLGLENYLQSIFKYSNEPMLFIENWVTSKGNWADDVKEDQMWLIKSIKSLKAVLR
jgi:3-oxoisoapionate decarboxylase